MVKDREEYLKILEELLSEQYGTKDESESLTKNTRINIEYQFKKKLINYNEIIDLTNSKLEEIRNAIYDYGQFKVGNFLIKISSHHGNPNKRTADDSQTMLNLAIWETRFKTTLGNPCNMDYKLDILKDTRFQGRPWLSLFNHSGLGTKVPVAVLIDIIRWMQVVKKLPAFI